MSADKNVKVADDVLALLISGFQISSGALVPVLWFVGTWVHGRVDTVPPTT